MHQASVFAEHRATAILPLNCTDFRDFYSY